MSGAQTNCEDVLPCEDATTGAEDCAVQLECSYGEIAAGVSCEETAMGVIEVELSQDKVVTALMNVSV